MARTKIPLTVLGPDGRPFATAPVTIRNRVDNSTATIYQAETGATTLANPQSTGTDGKILGWVERGKYNAVVAATPPLAGFTEGFESSPGGDQTIDGPWFSDAGILAAILPLGIAFPYPFPNEPAGGYWKFMNGQSLLRASYPDLHAAVAALTPAYGFGWGSGNGTTTFTVPDWSGHVPAGIGGTLALALGGKAGATTHTLTAAQLPKHTHAITDPGHAHSNGPNSNYWPGINLAGSDVQAGIGTGPITAGLSASQSASTGISVPNSNGGANPTGDGAHPIVQPTVGVNWLMRAK